LIFLYEKQKIKQERYLLVHLDHHFCT